MLVFDKCADPITVEQKYKLQLIGSFCVNEEVKTAAFGSLRHARRLDEEVKVIETNFKLRTTYTKQSLNNADVEMIESKDDYTINEQFDIKIRTDLDFTKRVVCCALN